MSPSLDNVSAKFEETETNLHSTHGLALKDDSEDNDAPLGVKTIEASHKVYGKYSKWALFISLGLAAYIYSLDSTTTYTYLSYTASEFDDHSLISPIQVAQSIVIAVGKPTIAKVADVSSRGTAYIFVVVFYVVGYIVVASAKSIQMVAGGIILYAFGNTGLQLLTQIIIADVTPLKWRGLATSLTLMPFVINVFVGANISAAVVTSVGWRWGYGMFAILVPVTLLPLIVTLLWAENKVRKLGIVMAGTRSETAVPKKPFFQRLLHSVNQIDVPGLLLLGASVALILLPLTLSKSAKNGWNSASMIVMLVVGCVLIPVFVLYEFKFAQYPVVARRFVYNRSVVGACVVCVLDFASVFLTFTYLYSFIVVVKPWSLTNAMYVTSTQTVALSVFGIIAGVGMRFLRRYKSLLIVGLGIRLIGIGLMIHSRGADGSDAELVWTQLLQGIGGGFAGVSALVGAQASVSHADVAMVTAIFVLFLEIGAAIGSAIAGAIWTNLMPGRLAKYLPFVSEEERSALFGSIVEAAADERGTPIREGVIKAYDDVMKIMAIAATVLAVFSFFFAFLMPNWYLGDNQNAVETVDFKDKRFGETDVPPPQLHLYITTVDRV